jgi:hypothetical protein
MMYCRNGGMLSKGVNKPDSRNIGMLVAMIAASCARSSRPVSASV